MIKQIAWNNEARENLLIAGGVDIDLVGEQVKSGIAQLWQHDINGTTGYTVTRIDVEGLGPELVLVLGQGSGLKYVVPYFLDAAHNLGIKSVRVHVKRRGLIKMFGQLGFNLDMYVLRASVSNGQ